MLTRGQIVAQVLAQGGGVRLPWDRVIAGGAVAPTIAISGTVSVGGTLTATVTGTPTPTLTLMRDGVSAGTITSPYTYVAGDIGPAITVVASNAGGSATSNTLTYSLTSDIGAALNAWFDDGTHYATGTWSDQSGNGRNFTQATAGKRPSATTLNSRAALDADGSDDTIASAASLGTIMGASAAFEIVAVFNADTLLTHGAHAAEGYEGNPLIRTDNGARFWLTVDSAAAYGGIFDGTNFCYAKSTVAPSTGTAYRLRVIVTGGTGASALQVQLGSNGVKNATVAPAANIDSRADTMAMFNSVAQAIAFDGKCGEMILTGALTATQRANLDGWVAYRWGAQT